MQFSGIRVNRQKSCLVGRHMFVQAWFANFLLLLGNIEFCFRQHAMRVMINEFIRSMKENCESDHGCNDGGEQECHNESQSHDSGSEPSDEMIMDPVPTDCSLDQSLSCGSFGTTFVVADQPGCLGFISELSGSADRLSLAGQQLFSSDNSC